jgi:hypothetical protein
MKTCLNYCTWSSYIYNSTNISHWGKYNDHMNNESFEYVKKRKKDESSET